MAYKKFGKGDTIIGNFRNQYGVTKRGTKHIVIDTDYESGNNYEDIKVQVIEGVDTGYMAWVSSIKFDLVQRAKEKLDLVKKESKRNDSDEKQYTINYDEKLGATFIRVGDVTIAVPVEEHLVSVTAKHPEDVECDEIAKAVAFYRLAKGVKV
jgi:hypothetical protein